jgi:hypothetical protein
MRNRWERALYGLAAGTALTIALAGLASQAAAAAQRGKPSVTPECSVFSYCSDPLFNAEFGMQYFSNNASAVRKLGNPVDLSWANDNNPGEDWHVTLQATVSVLYHLGFIGAAMELHFRSRPAFEVMWTPYGVTSNMCRGTARPATQGEMISLQPCGKFPETLWVVDNDDAQAGHGEVVYGGNALVAGSTRNPSVPYVMTAGGISDSNPFAQLRTEQLTADEGVPNPRQLWCTATESFPSPSSSAGPPVYSANSPCFPAGQIGSLSR